MRLVHRPPSIGLNESYGKLLDKGYPRNFVSLYRSNRILTSSPLLTPKNFSDFPNFFGQGIDKLTFQKNKASGIGSLRFMKHNSKDAVGDQQDDGCRRRSEDGRFFFAYLSGRFRPLQNR